jgi:hypothetical protein
MIIGFSLLVVVLISGTALISTSARPDVENLSFHDIAVRLEPVTSHYLGVPLSLKVTVKNEGTFAERNISIVVIADGEIVDTSVIDFLGKRNSQLLEYEWKPEHKGTYNVTAYALPISLEYPLDNNAATIFVDIVGKILIVSDDGGIYSKKGTSLEEFASALAGLGLEYDVWIQDYHSPNGSLVSSATLDEYSIVIWTCGDYLQYVIDPYYEGRSILEYFRKGGNILLEGETVVSSLVGSKGFELLNDMLGVSCAKAMMDVGGIEPSYTHDITTGLGRVNWSRTPGWGPDGVTTVGKSFSVMAFSNTNFSAVSVLDGTETGTGSVVYYSFSIFCLPAGYRNTLVNNTIAWFNGWGLSKVVESIIHSAPHSVQFVYSNPEMSTEHEFDLVAGGMFYSLCEYEQNQMFTDAVNVSALRGTICLFGSVSDQKIIREYNSTGSLPVTVREDPIDSKHYVFRDRIGKILYDAEIVSGKNSTFAIQVFADKSNNTTSLVIYGLDWRGAWAAGMFFSRVVCEELRRFSGKYYVFKWEDVNGDSIPQVDGLREVELVASG